MLNERVTRSFPARLDSVPAILAFAVSECSARDLPEKRSMDLELALEEAAVNTCSYAYPDGDGEVRVSIWEEGDRIFVEISDSGVPFDPLSKADPDVSRPLEERPVGGLGIHLIKRVADGACYRRSGDRNLLTLAFGKEAQ